MSFHHNHSLSASSQCFPPAFEHLLKIKSDNDNILDLAFDLATWHALAKLREHTDLTLDGLDSKTVDCGASVRRFAKKTCVNYITLELPAKDGAARGRRKAALTKGKGKTGKTVSSTSRKVKAFNYTTYKFHAMRDYAPAIRGFAAGDNFTTQVVCPFPASKSVVIDPTHYHLWQGELEHRHVKRFYARTNKVQASYQIAQHTRRAEKLRLIKIRVDVLRADMAAKAARRTTELDSDQPPSTAHNSSPPSSPVQRIAISANAQVSDPERLPFSQPEARFHIADSQRDSDDLSSWVASRSGDPAVQVRCGIAAFLSHPRLPLRLQDFVLNLKNHVLARLDRDAPLDESTYTAAHRSALLVKNNRIYWHQVARINYTTYDRQRTQDSINPRTHSDILLLAQDREHEYLYARVLKVLHVNARVASPTSEEFERVDVLWVRWFRIDSTHTSGFKAKRLPRLEFVPFGDSDSESFGFVDPVDVLRSAHIIPAFAHGRTATLLGPSLARHGAGALPAESSDEDTDFRYHYVNM